MEARLSSAVTGEGSDAYITLIRKYSPQDHDGTILCAGCEVFASKSGMCCRCPLPFADVLTQNESWLKTHQAHFNKINEYKDKSSAAAGSSSTATSAAPAVSSSTLPMDDWVALPVIDQLLGNIEGFIGVSCRSKVVAICSILDTDQRKTYLEFVEGHINEISSEDMKGYVAANTKYVRDARSSKKADEQKQVTKCLLELQYQWP